MNLFFLVFTKMKCNKTLKMLVNYKISVDYFFFMAIENCLLIEKIIIFLYQNSHLSLGVASNLKKKYVHVCVSWKILKMIRVLQGR